MPDKPAICLYAVPNGRLINSGPMARVSAFSNELQKNANNIVIKGGAWSKIRRSVSCRECEILYVESSTNRLRMVDYLCLSILHAKSHMVIVYIRDVYFEMFPEQYHGLFNRIRMLLHQITNRYYKMMADYLAFPTMEMAKISRIGKDNSRVFALPPACDLRYQQSQLTLLSNKRLSKLKVINVGGFVGYNYSGLDIYLDYIANTSLDAIFYIVTRDIELVKSELKKRDMMDMENIKLMSLSRDDMFRLIEEEGMTFAFHSRPRNKYDDVTYPIKIFDYMSVMLPVISERHVPMQGLFGSSYPLFCELSDTKALDAKMEKWMNAEEYNELLSHTYNVAQLNTYSRRIESILDIYCGKKSALDELT